MSRRGCEQDWVMRTGRSTEEIDGYGCEGPPHCEKIRFYSGEDVEPLNCFKLVRNCQ